MDGVVVEKKVGGGDEPGWEPARTISVKNDRPKGRIKPSPIQSSQSLSVESVRRAGHRRRVTGRGKPSAGKCKECKEGGAPSVRYNIMQSIVRGEGVRSARRMMRYNIVKDCISDDSIRSHTSHGTVIVVTQSTIVSND